MEALVLTAGKGTRLYPLSKTIPKPLIPIAGRPLICHILDALIANVDRVVIVIGHKADLVEETISQMDYPFEINWVNQQEQLGTGNAVRICEKYIDTSHFFMMYGDIFTSQRTIKDIISLGQSNDLSGGILSAKKVNNPEKYGCLDIKKDYLVRILEKDPQPPSTFINAGVMVLPSTIFDSLASTPESNRGEIEVTEGINQLIKNGAYFSLYYIKDHWIDIGYPWNLLTANEVGMQKMQFPSKLPPTTGVTIEGSLKLANSATLLPGTFIQGPVIIDENTTVGPNCYIRPGTYLGKNVRIGNAVEIKNSLILDNATIGHLTYLGDSIIGKGCNFGAGTKVANLKLDNDDIYMTIQGEKISTGRRKFGVLLGDNVKTGINVSLMPGITIGENSQIGAHTLVNQDVPPNTLLYHDPNQGLIKKNL
ncbi:MAG: bifunctional sugar-1-phosphate nucleotidylyltransferase/acetyltransferase [Candidatus Hodarchaeales archaeon]|jgi:bifunctional UDP-N-acetylglucosamine pyrophosphorylase/glucosamine-1-phosphate N-acetyltransferase